ncbi:hypothetical protein BWQ96_09302 [Gracilariopsis chorda]|uniref:Uncharacterized protein n=1 Tax=Gracilariopsis chorda TaxID=448386 RepID=A0A2V3IFY7_9FLOR|nr:hypothetical protein BWQ96_09302 [Gracilariopsis chorda]|eukprot:PXF40971.1 hypothetical protein BWQ96_09302 [Gracilariopsis chorda]
METTSMGPLVLRKSNLCGRGFGSDTHLRRHLSVAHRRSPRPSSSFGTSKIRPPVRRGAGGGAPPDESAIECSGVGSGYPKGEEYAAVENGGEGDRENATSAVFDGQRNRENPG